jgi:hypothetical protein
MTTALCDLVRALSDEQLERRPEHAVAKGNDQPALCQAM